MIKNLIFVYQKCPRTVNLADCMPHSSTQLILVVIALIGIVKIAVWIFKSTKRFLCLDLDRSGQKSFLSHSSSFSDEASNAFCCQEINKNSKIEDTKKINCCGKCCASRLQKSKKKR